MKLIQKSAFFLITFFLLFTSITFANNESNVESNKNVTTGETIKVFNTDLYLGGQDIVVSDAVNGNIFAFGSSITLKGEILGDVFILARTLVIEESATIHGNIFVFSNNTIIKGKVNYDVYSLGQNFELTDTGYINRDIRLLVANAKLYGTIKKDAFLFVDSILMSDTAENIIGGNLHYTSDKEFVFPEKAIMGNIRYTQYQRRTYTPGEIVINYAKQFISDISLVIVVVLLAVFLAPKWIDNINYALMKRPFVSTGIGILATVLIPVFALFLLFTGFFTTLSIIILVLYGLVLAISLSLFSLAIAKWLASKWNITSKGKFILFAIASSIVLWIARLLPVLGTYVSLFISVVGLGVFLTSAFKKKNI